ncbi:MAG: thioredoxin [Verrucomicrobia bacterium]|nr:MAG: thioredoxin [Verrucomicrobiota bacterium]
MSKEASSRWSGNGRQFARCAGGARTAGARGGHRFARIWRCTAFAAGRGLIVLRRKIVARGWSARLDPARRCIRAYDPWPGTYSHHGNGGRLKIFPPVQVVDTADLAPGQVRVQDQQLLVGCGAGALVLSQLQAEGGKLRAWAARSVVFRGRADPVSAGKIFLLSPLDASAFHCESLRMAHAFNDSNFSTEVLESSVPVLVDFWAEWCGPCKAIGPIIDQLAQDVEGQAKVGKVNVDEARDLAVKYGVRSIPFLLFFK